MKLEILLLMALYGESASGYELKKFLDTSGRFLRSNTTMSQVYRTLGTLEVQGKVTHTVEPRPGASDVKRYTITEEGEAALQDWIAGPYSPPSRFQDPDFVARLSMAGHMTDEQLLALVDTELASRMEEVVRYRERERPVIHKERMANPGQAAQVSEWAHRYQSAAMDAHIKALIDLRTRLLDGRPLIDETSSAPHLSAPATEEAQ
jgi:PadR family transcriptional regulator, regulatory protein AphA